MPAIELSPLHHLPPAARRDLPRLRQRPGTEYFVVVREGRCVHGEWGAGEVLVCQGEARDGDRVVLVARGHGRPRVGSLRNGRLYGDAGERCHPSRWRVAGRLVATWRRRADGWICALLDPEADVGSVALEASHPGQGTQLSLFAA